MNGGDNPNLKTMNEDFVKPKSYHNNVTMNAQNIVKPSMNSKQQLNYKKRKCKVQNKSKYQLFEIRIKESVIPKIWLACLLLTVWAALCAILHKSTGFNIGENGNILSVTGIVLGLLLVFRTNSAYAHYWQAHEAWSDLTGQIRILSKYIWVISKVETAEDMQEKIGAINLLAAFAVSLKHYLRNELGLNYKDLFYLISHVPDFITAAEENSTEIVPLHISGHVLKYISRCRSRELIAVPESLQMYNQLNRMVDIISKVERIRDNPTPLAYTIHLQQTLFVYLVFLPFQIVKGLGYYTILISAIASFTILGTVAIGQEVENPFGYDRNDLDLDEICESLKLDLIQLQGESSLQNAESWTVVNSILEEYN